MKCVRLPIDIMNDLNLNLTQYPVEFVNYCATNDLKYPNISTGNGMGLCAMLLTHDKYWSRISSDAFVKKYNIQSKDSIQLFNKHSQWGIATSTERGKNYILYPYRQSNKNKMRKNFKFDGTDQEKNDAINQIKNEIKGDYLNVSNEKWQIGHKNPESCDNTNYNMVLQPPIQGKYRDNYIFIDTLTKIPTPKKLITMYNSDNCPYTKEQLIECRNWLNSLKLN
jgi:hypothetical protein